MNSLTSASPMISGGISLITSMWSPDTWVRIRCRWNRATTTICANSPTRAFCSMAQPALAFRPDGLPNSMPIIRPAPAHVLDQVEAVGQRGEPGAQRLARPGGVLHQALVLDDRERRQPGRHRQRAALERGAVHHDLVHGRVDRAEDLVRREHRADRDVAAGQRLGHGDDVRPHVLVLVGEELAGPAEPGLHLVADQQRPVLVQQRRCLGQGTRRAASSRHVPAPAR